MCSTVVVMNRTLLAATAVLAVASMGLSACSGDASSNSESVKSETSSADITWNDADVKFVQEMIPHHEQAVEMSDMLSVRDVTEETAALAQRIGATQSDEVRMMQGYLAEWGVELDPHAGHSGDHAMGEGMMTAEQLAELGAATGGAFERMWLTMMLEHHKGAIAMANAVVASGVEPRVRAFAESIVTAQGAEITQIEGLLATLGG